MRQLKISKQITNRDSISLNKYLSDISAIPLLKEGEEIELANRIKDGDELAFKRFIEGNLRFVISVAKQYQQSGESLDDLISAGNAGLIKAAERFDVSRGFKFISFAVWWIRQSIMQYLNENSKSIRLPSNKIGFLNKVKNISIKLEQELQRSPTLEEIHEILVKDGDIILHAKEDDKIFDDEKTSNKKNKLTAEEKEEKNLKESISALNNTISSNASISSLDVKLGEDQDSTLIDFIITDSLMDVNIPLRNSDLQITLEQILKKRLHPREKEVLIYTFGLFGNKAKTIEEIGLSFDLTRERVRQIKDKALRKLRSKDVSKNIREFI